MEPSSSTTNALTSVIFIRPAAQVVGEPAKHAPEEVDPVLGQTAGAEEEVRPARVADEFGLAAGPSQRHEHLLALAERAALVGLAVDDQGRRRSPDGRRSTASGPRTLAFSCGGPPNCDSDHV